MQSGSGWPDLFIPEPRNGKYGLFIELKKADTTIYLKNGELVSNPHIREQAEVLNLLESKGYVATFAVGFSEVEKILAEYLNPAHSALQA